MELQQPWMLWGLAGIVVPVAIHFWYQKQGQIMEWAASRWLVDHTNLKHRGIRLHEIPLMLLRCLLIALLALILSQPVVDWLKNSAAAKTVHLVEPNAAVVSNYRFEIENALKSGEKVLWSNGDGVPMRDASNIPNAENPKLYLQNVINRASSNAGVKLKIYLSTDQQLLASPKIYVPGPFELYPVADPAAGRLVSYLNTKDGQKLAIDPQSQLLTKMETAPVGYRFKETAAHAGIIRVLVDFKNKREKETVKAAIRALEEVYQIPFEIHEVKVQGKNYAWILSDQLPGKIGPRQLYVVTGHSEPLQPQVNINYLPDPLLIESSGLVRDGRLPEYLGEFFTDRIGLDQSQSLVSKQQLTQIFVKAIPKSHPQKSKLQTALLLVFVLLTMLERWIALRKRHFVKYG